MSIVSVGAYTRDLYMFVDRLPLPGETIDSSLYEEADGGKAANQAVAAARVGAEVYLITKLGNDSYGKDANDLIEFEGIKSDFVYIDKKNNTGISFITVDINGVQLIVNHVGASNNLVQDDILPAKNIIKKASVILLQGEIDPKISFFTASLAAKRSIVILDPSPVESFQGFNLSEMRIDILTPNLQEAKILSGKNKPTAKSIAQKYNVPIVVLKLGENGAEVYDGETYHIPPFKVKAVDTTGAGDAFNGVLGAGLDRGLSLSNAAKRASRLAAASVTRKFCIPSFPTEEEFPWESEQ